jgi:N-acetylmuramoyl-L-alanine amidase
MEHQHLSRRRLLWSTALSVPLLAACSDDASRDAGSDTPPQSAAEVEAAASATPTVERATTQPAAAAEQQATPVAESTSPRPRTIVLDPGHGAEEVGAASAIAGMPNLTEKDSNLAFSWRLRTLLESDGLRVVMTRESDSRAFGYVRPENPSPGPGGLTPARADLQARVDFANQSGADLFLSVHSNDSGSLDENGVEVWYCGDREVGDRTASGRRSCSRMCSTICAATAIARPTGAPRRTASFACATAATSTSSCSVRPTPTPTTPGRR